MDITIETRRALSVGDVANYKPMVLPFDNEWELLMGCPESTGAWLIWGNSGNGKTRFALMLAKYLANWRRVAYDSLEEGLSLSMQKAFAEVNMSEAGRKLILLDKEPIEELSIRLRKRKSPEVIFIDSLQYTGLNYAYYKALKTEFKTKLFVFVSHADGREPAGRVGKSIKYDANVKIRVEGFKAFAASRYGGGNPLTVWAEGAERFDLE